MTDQKLAIVFSAAEQYCSELREIEQLLADIRRSLKGNLDKINSEWDSTGKDRAYFLDNMGTQVENIKYLNEAINVLYNTVERYVRETKQTQNKTMNQMV